MRWDTTPEYEASVTHDLFVRALARIGCMDLRALTILRQNFNPIVLGVHADDVEETDVVRAIMVFIDSEMITRG